LERNLDFEDAAVVFEGLTRELVDFRKDYGERRVICYGWLGDKLVAIGYTQRGDTRHIFSMRRANAREKAKYAPEDQVGSGEG